MRCWVFRITEIFSIPQFLSYNLVNRFMKANADIATAVMAWDAKITPFKEVGNTVTFGTYPQTKEGTDQTPIEWVVLEYDVANNKALLLSKKGIDAVSYNNNTRRISLTWGQCSLRTWLNDEFLNRAFSTVEQSAILITDVDNSAGQGYSGFEKTKGGNNTQDRIFLLSYAEASSYLGVDSENYKYHVVPTDYAITQWTYKSNKTAVGEPTVWWWLRSPGPKQDMVCCVGVDGKLCLGDTDSDFSLGGNKEYYGFICVLPAFWLNLESNIF